MLVRPKPTSHNSHLKLNSHLFPWRTIVREAFSSPTNLAGKKLANIETINSIQDPSVCLIMITCCRFVLSIIVIIQSRWVVDAAVSFSVSDVPSCLIVSRLRGNTTITEPSQSQRIIVIGDIHGDQRGFFEVLYASGIIRSLNECAWKLPQSSSSSDPKIHPPPVDAGFSYDGTLFVQTGDVVDRGPNTLGSS